MKKIIILCAAILMLSGCQTQTNQNSSTPDGSSTQSSSPDVDDPTSDDTELALSGFQRNMNINSPLRLPTVCKTENGYYL